MRRVGLVHAKKPLAPRTWRCAASDEGCVAAAAFTVLEYCPAGIQLGLADALLTSKAMAADMRGLLLTILGLCPMTVQG